MHRCSSEKGWTPPRPRTETMEQTRGTSITQFEPLTLVSGLSLRSKSRKEACASPRVRRAVDVPERFGYHPYYLPSNTPSKTSFIRLTFSGSTLPPCHLGPCPIALVFKTLVPLVRPAPNTVPSWSPALGSTAAWVARRCRGNGAQRPTNLRAARECELFLKGEDRRGGWELVVTYSLTC